MKISTLFLFIFLLINGAKTFSQIKRPWTEKDRLFLVQNLERTRNLLIAGTKTLTMEQWSFKPDSTQWSIGQVLEHLGLYERIFAQEADIMLSTAPDPEMDTASLNDTTYLNWMNDPSLHKAEWNAQPLGFMKGNDNLEFFLFGRNHLIDFIRNTSYDLKSHFTYRWGDEKRRSIHGLMVVHFGHSDRHLKQILKLKANPKFPK
ncbi:MAG: DinB family protein [Bacteroidota bacterium]